MNRLLKFLPIAVLAMMLSSAIATAANVDRDGRPLYHDGEVIVKYKDGVFRTRAVMDSIYNSMAVVEVQHFSGAFKNFEHLMFDTRAITVEEAVEQLQRDPAVEYAQPNYIMYALPVQEEMVDVADAQAGEPCLIPGVDFPPGCDPNAAPPGGGNPPPPGGGDGQPCLIPGIDFPPGCDPGSAPPPPGDGDGQPCLIPGIDFPPGCDPNAAPPAPPGGGNPGNPGERPAINPMPEEPSRGVDPRMGELYGMTKIDAPRAWEIEQGSKEIVVAVIDTGVDYNHPDLAYNIWRNPNAETYAATGIDPTGADITGDIVGWDFIHNDNLPFDDQMHGSHCAGTIGGVGNNGVGVSGVAQRVSIMAVKFLSSQGSGTTADAIKAIDYAISRGAKILSNSWGGPGDEDNQALEDAVVRAQQAGVLFVAAAGNDGTDNDSRPMYPAAYPQDNVIAVAATNEQDSRAFFSNYGVETVDVGAPGSGILSTTPNGNYQKLSGTSMAAPHVSGAAALLWAHFPEATYTEIKERLLRFGDPIPSLQGKTVTGMRINVYKALTGEL